MITILWDLIQGTPEWLETRKGYITGTDAHRILRGDSIESVITEKNTVTSSFEGNYWTHRGHLLESESKKLYEELYQKVDDAGFILNDKYPLAAYSPDGLVGDDGLIECKSFKEEKHLEVFHSLSPEIIAQTQFGLFVSEREWCDLLLYNPDIKDLSKVFLVKRLKPIPEIQERLKSLFTKT